MAELAELSDTQRQPSRGRRLLQFSLRTLFVVMAFFALLCAVGVTLYNSLPNEVTRAEVDQLRPGMTKGRSASHPWQTRRNQPNKHRWAIRREMDIRHLGLDDFPRG